MLLNHDDPRPIMVQGLLSDSYIMRSAFPDMKVNVDLLVADQDGVAYPPSLPGLHEGSFMGVRERC